MARGPKERLRPLTERERETLVAVTKAGRERVDRMRWATALLAVAQGETFAQAAERAGFGSDTTVAGLVGRFNRRGLVALDIAGGRGRKPTADPMTRPRGHGSLRPPNGRRIAAGTGWLPGL